MCSDTPKQSSTVPDTSHLQQREKREKKNPNGTTEKDELKITDQPDNDGLCYF